MAVRRPYRRDRYDDARQVVRQTLEGGVSDQDRTYLQTLMGRSNSKKARQSPPSNWRLVGRARPSGAGRYFVSSMITCA